MVYLPILIHLHENTFDASPRSAASLPPQSSEALMGWRKLSNDAERSPRDYLSLLAFLRARLTYTVLRTAYGATAPDHAMSADQAKRALPKLITFFNAFDIEPLLDGSALIERISNKDPKFAEFLKGEFRELLRQPEKFGCSPDGDSIGANMMSLRDHVPFANYTYENIL